MGKAKRERVLADNEAMAISKNLRVSPQKLNLVAGLIRGKKVDQAMADLEFSRKRIAVDVRKCVMSAVANAENNHNLDVNDLVVSEAHVGRNIVMRRFHARGRGRAAVVEKPFSQITVVVREDDGEAEAAKAGKDTKKKSAKPKAKSDDTSDDKPKAKAKPAAKKKAAPKAKKPAEPKTETKPKAKAQKEAE